MHDSYEKRQTTLDVDLRSDFSYNWYLIVILAQPF